MATARHHLRVVPAGGAPRAIPDHGIDGELGDLLLTATLLAISLLPIASAVAHVGRWGDGELGLGAAGSLLAGRELWACARAAIRERGRRP